MMKKLISMFLASFCLVTTLLGQNNQMKTTEAKTVKVAMAQIMCLDGDRSGNLVRIENAMAEAKEKHVDIIVFPESCILGWVNPDAHKNACTIPGDDSKTVCALAKKYDLYVCIGMDEKEGDMLFDAALLIDNQGAILLKHRKINVLPELMNPPYAVGKQVEVVKTKFGKIGILICADTMQDDVVDKMQAQKPDLLLVPYGWADQEKAWPEHGQALAKVVKGVSNKLNCPVVGTNLIGQISHGPWTGQTYGGQSVAFDVKSNTLLFGRERERDINVVVLHVQ